MGNGQTKGDLKQEISQAVIKPIQKELGQFVEAGIQSVTGSYPQPVDPEEEARRKQEEEMRKQNIIRFFQELQKQAELYRMQKLKEEQAKQKESQNQSQEQQKDILEQKKKRALFLGSIAKGRVELKRGIGG